MFDKTAYQKAYMAKRRATARAERAARPKSKRCSHCDKPAAKDRIVVGDGVANICEVCWARAGKLIAGQRQ
jgi:formylmethanofuran dehydrogenase subunit E